jgi:hypothetical protein
MKIEDIFTGKDSEISLKIKPAIRNEVFKEIYNQEVKISFLQDTYWMEYSDGKRIEIEGISSSDSSNLDRISTSLSINFIIKSNKTMADLKARLFVSKMPISTSLEIGFGDIILDDIDKRFYRQLNGKKKDDWLEDELIITSNNRDKILVNHSPKEGGFRIFGKHINVDVQNKNNKLTITKIIKNTKLEVSSYVETDINIKDLSQTAKIGDEIAIAIGKINPTESYLNTWQKYQKEEEKKIEEAIKKIGFLTITNIIKIGNDKYKLAYKRDNNTNNWMNIADDASIELLSNRELPSDDSQIKERLMAKIISIEYDTLIVTSSNDKFKLPKDNKLLYARLSPIGDITMQKRRNDALDKIKEGSTPMPQLAGILEGIENISSIQRRTITPLSSNVKKIFGEYGPNEMQELALDKALNTPDVVIIQGPPGTGKTKVISALSQRLAEEFKESGKSPEKEILLTSFQHDAVDNMVLRTEVFGLPTIKPNDKSNTIDIIDSWIKKQTEQIESIQMTIEPNLYEFIYKEVKNEYLKYIEHLDQQNAKKYLKEFRKQYIDTISDEIVMQIELLFKEPKKIDNAIKTKIEKLVRNLRTDKISFDDDGEINLKRFLTNYERYKDELEQLSSEYITILQNIFRSKDLTGDDYTHLDMIKLDFLDKLISQSNIEQINKPNYDITKIFKQIIDLYSQLIKSKGSIHTVLSEYQQNLATNETKIKNTIEQYSALLASTIQGSASKTMRNTKADPFDTVIVDEAARSNPLDLLIPLTSAKRRIVLVGDHRQLPHIVDKAIQDNLENSDDVSFDISKHLEDSLFERFFTILKRLEKKDGIKRVVTLDTQYRMHPYIGDFISRTFYEKYGDPKISSGTPAEVLQHNLDTYKGKVAVSINIPHFKGSEKKDNGSTYRSVEAKEIIKRAKDILDTDPSLSVGIITFYSRQVREIFKEAVDNSMAIQNDKGEFIISKKYEITTNDEERLRIGSVDAFQGKEFDVVLLSLVRSNNIDINDKSKGRQKYGFLTSYNRLNVAMSRAKKLLIAVGDEEMFRNIQAKEAIYGLYAFYAELIDGSLGISINEKKSLWNRLWQ